MMPKQISDDASSRSTYSCNMKSPILSYWFWAIFLTGLTAIGYLYLRLLTLNTFDEGFIAKGAEIVLSGKLLIRDFLTLYGPAQFYILAAMYSVFGVQLVLVRIWSILAIALFAWITYRNTTTLANGSHTIGMVAMALSLVVFVYYIPQSGYPMVPAAALLCAAALPLYRFLTTGELKGLKLSSALIGIAALFRWDIGVLGLAGLAATLLYWSVCCRSFSKPSLFLLLKASLLPALVIDVGIYLPWTYFGDWNRYIDEAFIYPLRHFSAYRGISFVEPHLLALLREFVAGNPRAVVVKAVPLALLFLTWFGIMSTILSACLRLWRPKSEHAAPSDAAFITALFLALVTLGLLNQMRVRPGTERLASISVAVIPLGAYWWNIYFPRFARIWRPFMRRSTISCSIAYWLYAALLADSVNTAIKTRDAVAFSGDRARFVRGGLGDPQYNSLIEYISRNTKPEETIFSGVRDHQVILVNDVMIYFLTGRNSPTRYYEMDPGLANTLQAQQKIVADLAEQKTRLLVLWDLSSHEKNLSSTPDGIDLLDRYIFENYRRDALFGKYQVWIRLQSAAPEKS